MMNNKYEDLLKLIEEEIEDKYNSNKKLLKILGKIKSGKITYVDAHNYSEELGDLISKILTDKISSGALINGKLEPNIAKLILNPVLKKNHKDVSKVCIAAQDIMNKSNKLGINAVKTKTPKNKINGLIKYASSAEQFDDVKNIFRDAVLTFSQKNVDDFIKVNADFSSKSGLEVTIIRTVKGDCCDWCKNLAGVYDYNDVSSTGTDVYLRHRKCRCLVTYSSNTKKRFENVHTKKELSYEERNDIANKMLNNLLKVKEVE